MSIYLFTEKNSDGSGDIVHTVKVADHIQRFMATKRYNGNIIIVVPEAQHHKGNEYFPDSTTDHQEITKSFLSDVNRFVHVQTLNEFEDQIRGSTDLSKIDLCLKVTCTTCLTDEIETALSRNNIPIIYLPEYSNDTSPENAKLILRGGFNQNTREQGVIPSQYLLDATARPITHDQQMTAFTQLKLSIQQALGTDHGTFIANRSTHGLSFQYSNEHSDEHTLTFQCAGNAKDMTQTNEVKRYTPTTFFLQEHCWLTEHSSCSQNVICIGKHEETKLTALKAIQQQLIANGFQNIVFVNLDTKDEKYLYLDHTTTKSSDPIKSYRLLYTKKVPYETMQALLLLSNQFVGATGDHSLVEAMSARRLVSYECKPHKAKFIQGCLDQIDSKTANKDVRLLAKYLLKKRSPYSEVEYDESTVKNLLQNTGAANELRRINSELVAESKYLECLEQQLNDWVFDKAQTQAQRDALNLKVQDEKNKYNQSIQHIKSNTKRWHRGSVLAGLLTGATVGTGLGIGISYFTSSGGSTFLQTLAAGHTGVAIGCGVSLGIIIFLTVMPCIISRHEQKEKKAIKQLKANPPREVPRLITPVTSQAPQPSRDHASRAIAPRDEGTPEPTPRDLIAGSRAC